MNIHEYQAKELFEKYGVASPNGQVAETAEEAKAYGLIDEVLDRNNPRKEEKSA